MTIDNDLEGLSLNNIQQHPFHIVLVDIKKSAREYKIHCIKTPLTDDKDLRYVALSYRWGEVDETMVGTGVGYSVALTSIALDSLLDLCGVMTYESDLKHMDYLWIDTICVEQDNDERRKVTIHQMSNIYNRAKYILAVPDLHLAYLDKISTKNSEIIDGSEHFGEDLYYLIHGDTTTLAVLDEKWLDEYDVPNDPSLRQLLTKYTNHFTESLMKYREHHWAYNEIHVINHLYEASSSPSSDAPIRKGPFLDMLIHKTNPPTPKNTTDDTFLANIKQLHQCHQQSSEGCPLDLSIMDQPQWKIEKLAHKYTDIDHREWNQMMYERSTMIRQSMHFMMDLIKDWASRVWVISEYSIAKKNNNLKYWFTQLVPTLKAFEKRFVYQKGKDISFFKFKFGDPSFSKFQNAQVYSKENCVFPYQWGTSDPVYLKFHQTLIFQLEEQSFLQMILASKACKMVDRFYAILPLSEKYKHMKILMENDTRTLMAVKMQLYNWMDVKDKLNLLFLSASWQVEYKGMLSPTFATSTISWHIPLEFMEVPKQKSTVYHQAPYNFDLNDPSSIILVQKQQDLPYLNIKPKEYYLCTGIEGHPSVCFKEENQKEYGHLACFQATDRLDTIGIPSYQASLMGIPHHDYFDWIYNHIYLVGNFELNTWVVGRMPVFPLDKNRRIDYRVGDEYRSGFNIY